MDPLAPEGPLVSAHAPRIATKSVTPATQGTSTVAVDWPHPCDQVARLLHTLDEMEAAVIDLQRARLRELAAVRRQRAGSGFP